MREKRKDKKQETPLRVFTAAYGSVPEKRHLLSKAHHTADALIVFYQR